MDMDADMDADMDMDMDAALAMGMATLCMCIEGGGAGIVVTARLRSVCSSCCRACSNSSARRLLAFAQRHVSDALC